MSKAFAVPSTVMNLTFNEHTDDIGDDTLHIYTMPGGGSEDDASIMVHRRTHGWYDRSVVISRTQWDWLMRQSVFDAADYRAQARAIAEACALSQQDVQTVLDAVLESRAKDRLLDKLLRTVRLASDEFCFWDDYGHQWVLDEGERAVAKALRPNPSVTYPAPP